MRRYFQLDDDVHIPGRWHLGDVLEPSGDEPSLGVGSRVGEPVALHVEVSDVGQTLEFCTTASNIPICTKALAIAIEALAGSDVQCLPVEIGDQGGMVVLNAVRLVRCVDEGHSEFIKWTEHDHRADLAGEFRMITKLVLAHDAIPDDAHIFRIQGWEVALIVCEEMKAAMERVGCFGAKFIELET